MAGRDTSSEPISEYFTTRDTEFAGRGVFASKPIAKDTPLLKSHFIALTVLNREYRREVCAWCFYYERGRNLKFRCPDVNFSFCSQDCEITWMKQHVGVPFQAWKAVEEFIKSKLNKTNQGVQVDNDRNNASADNENDSISADRADYPSIEEVDTLWDSVESTADFIRQARTNAKSKLHQRALQAAKAVVPVPDVLYWLLAGILAHHSATHAELNGSHPPSWPALIALKADANPYPSAFNLRQHAYSYLQLLAISPPELLSSITSHVCRETMARDVHNSFAIRSLDDEGSEFFGWGVWPEASYFNHSCSPNVTKRRIDRVWRFWAARDIAPDEQLFISYLGGDEKGLQDEERIQRLKEMWGFSCLCTRCSVGHSQKLEDGTSNSGDPATNIEFLDKKLGDLSLSSDSLKSTTKS
jgi:SET domain-containing protein